MLDKFKEQRDFDCLARHQLSVVQEKGGDHHAAFEGLCATLAPLIVLS